MAIGDVAFQTLKIGGLDLLSGDATFHGADVYEDLNDPFGSPLIEINVVDFSDAMNKYKITGSQEENKIEMSLKYEPTGEVVGFSGVMHSNEALQDRSGNQNEGSLHSKQYCIRGCQPELLNANRNPVKKSFSGPTTDHVKTIFKDYAKSEKPFENRDSSEPLDKVYGQVSPIDATQDLMKNHTSKKYPSSTYVVFNVFEKGKPKIVQTTYEQLFEQSPVVTLKERTDLNLSGISEQDQQNSILYAQTTPSRSWQRAMSRGIKQSYNHTTGVVVDEKHKGDTKSKKPAYNKEYNDGEYIVPTVEDTMNTSQQNSNADARRKRAQFTSHLMNDSSTIECHYNPKITLGCTIELDIPKKTDNNQFGGEGQFNKKVLVVAIHHKFKPAGQRPAATMVLEVIKAGMEQGGASA